MRKGLKLLRYAVNEILESSQFNFTLENVISFIQNMDDQEFEDALK